MRAGGGTAVVVESEGGIMARIVRRGEIAMDIELSGDIEMTRGQSGDGDLDRVLARGTESGDIDTGHGRATEIQGNDRGKETQDDGRERGTQDRGPAAGTDPSTIDAAATTRPVLEVAAIPTADVTQDRARDRLTETINVEETDHSNDDNDIPIRT